MAAPTLIFLHALGASAGEWTNVMDHLPDHAGVSLDLPGFGDAAATGYADVATTADWLADEVRARAPASCLLVGHSMGGKIATLVAARAARGEPGLAGVLGVVLVAASPPAPEPMDEARRREMIGWFVAGRPSRADAETFVDANTAARLPNTLREAAIADVLRADCTAWLGWLERGANEDWSAAAGHIDLPALIVAGSEDGDLGAANQRRLNLPHYPGAELAVVPGAAHLIPYEQPEALAALIAAHADRCATAALPPAFVDLLGSDRVSRRTRAAMLARSRPGTAAAWTESQRTTLAALIAHVLPDAGADQALADRILAGVADGPGDGWRFAALPPDREAWARGLATLDALAGGFAAQPSDTRADLLQRIDRAETGMDGSADHLSPDQMRLWFEDARAEIARMWMSLPATMAAIGYDGFANGGDGLRKQGYVRTAADDIEAWQIGPENVA
jgi:pimeloyl-ACP methyl ester carboxylesterase